MTTATFQDVILEAAKKRQERALHAERVIECRRQELREMAREADEEPEKRMSWYPYLPYLRKAYADGVTQEEMANHVGDLTGRAIYPQTVGKVLQVHGIARKRTAHELVELLG